jgi:hypothetical protein
LLDLGIPDFSHLEVGRSFHKCANNEKQIIQGHS